jgi:hypothetical protein
MVASHGCRISWLEGFFFSQKRNYQYLVLRNDESRKKFVIIKHGIAGLQDRKIYQAFLLWVLHVTLTEIVASKLPQPHYIFIIHSMIASGEGAPLPTMIPSAACGQRIKGPSLADPWMYKSTTKLMASPGSGAAPQKKRQVTSSASLVLAQSFV